MNSLRLQIGLLYSLLAFVNIVFFSVMIFENQSDLLVRSFQLQSENLANTILSDIGNTVIDLEDRDGISLFTERINNYEASSFRIFSSLGEVYYKIPQDTDPFKEFDSHLQDNLRDLNSSDSSSIFKSRYKLELNEIDFSLVLTLPINIKGKQNTYLQAIVVFSGLQDRLNQIYIFMSIAVIWGIIFHFLFGIYVYKTIFNRLNILKKASDLMSAGNLNTRAGWKRKRNDELDILGDSFNQMAGSIQEKMNTISRLNFEINQELKIGKEVQELFLPNLKELKKFALGKIFLPLREVSGDIYFVKKIQKDNRESFIFFLADVSGHGVSASLVTVTISMFMESIVKETDEPVEIINRLNTLMGDRLQSSFFATAVAIRLEGNKLTSCNAGHNPPLIFQDRGSGIKEIPSSGPPLGMKEKHDYFPFELTLNPHDKILCYTDGMVETTDDSGNMFGIERIKDIVLAGINENTDNQSILEAIALSLNQYKDKYKDDLTAILWEIPQN
jgi:phosphoserine phosphatase RsbU/P